MGGGVGLPAVKAVQAAMSTKSKFKHSYFTLTRVAFPVHETMERARETFSVLHQYLIYKGIDLSSCHQVGGRHVKGFVDHLLDEGYAVGSMHTMLSAIRGVWRKIGKASLADDPNYSNIALIGKPRSRMGTKVPISDEDLEGAKSDCIHLGRPGIAHLLNLQAIAGGHRGAESIAGDEDELAKWERELRANQKLEIEKATKGGRRRFTQPVNRENALLVVVAALACARTQGGRLMTRRRGQGVPNFKQAIGAYGPFMWRREIEAHACRYRFACEAVHAYELGGMSRREALKATAWDLGHSGGRLYWVKQVYCREFEPMLAQGRVGNYASMKLAVFPDSHGVPMIVGTDGQPLVSGKGRNGGANE